MRVNRQRRNNLTYRQTVYVILTFYIVHRGICNSTDTNNSTSTSNSTVSDTNVYSTPNPPSVSSTTLDTSTDSQISIASNTISSTTNTLTAYSITTLNTSTSSSTLTAVSSTHTRSSILSNNASYTTSLDNTTTDITSSESSINVSTVYNTTYIPVTSLAINCTATINGTNNSSSKTCQQDIETIPVKSTSLTAEEGTNITIHGNDTWDCPDVVWYRHYNWSTHGHHIYPNTHYKTLIHRRKILTSHPICYSDRSSPTAYHDLCRSCNKTELRLYDLNTTNSGRYSRRCYKQYHHQGPHEDENFGLTVNPRNNTDNYTIPVCPRYVETQSQEDEQDDDYTLSTTINNNLMRKTGHYDISHGTHTTWALILICIACMLLFFVRRALNKKYRPLRDDISESSLVVQYHPEHED
ncbi:membrane protein RL12 [Human betaherpesvirus 5]|uniref:Membrane protein RL12 n=1 Tax=Human cytomegalovirus TaxID=10359 RepID=C8BKF9_HCMV|nr:membrane protein RL12 [Human betaherpesvirus 5]